MIFEIGAHPTFTLVFAPTLLEAIRKHALEHFVSEDPEGRLWYPGQGRIPSVLYSHELEVVECCRKIFGDWTIKRVSPQDWRKPIAHSFQGYSRKEEASFVKMCRLQIGDGATLPNRAFVWHLRSGPLVAFYHQRRYGREITPKALGPKYIISWSTWPEVKLWTGNYDDILADLDV
jgi:hypothetical protein